MARVLLIDDEYNVRMMVRLALQHVGHQVESAADGPDGLVKFGAGVEWDLVLLDQRMPGMEGLEVLRIMRERDPRARIVMITAFGTVDLAVEAMKAGATDFLRKPFSADTLRSAAQAALSPSHAQPARDPGVIPPTVYGFATLNGFRVESSPGAVERANGTLRLQYTVRDPEGVPSPCTVELPPYMVELVKADADRDEMPGGDRFWQALGEEVVANYVWQNAAAPSDAVLRVEEMTTGLRRWMESVLSVPQ